MRAGVSAELSVRRGREAVEFYEAAFGATEIYRVGGTDDQRAVVSQIAVGETSFWLADESPEHANWATGCRRTRTPGRGGSDPRHGPDGHVSFSRGRGQTRAMAQTAVSLAAASRV